MPQRYFEASVLQNFLNGDQLPGLRHSRLEYNSKRAISDNPLSDLVDIQLQRKKQIIINVELLCSMSLTLT